MSTLTHTGSHPVLACVDAIAEALDEVAGVEPVFMTTEQKQTALIELTKLSSRMESLKLRVLAAADDIAVETGARSTAAWLADTTRDHHGTVLRSARLAVAVDGRYRHRRRCSGRGPGQRRPSPRHRRRARGPAHRR